MSDNNDLYSYEVEDGFGLIRQGKCDYKKCKSACCRFFLVNGGNPGVDNYKKGFVDETNELGDHIFKRDCKNLSKDGKCTLWGTQNFPGCCSQFPHWHDNVYKHVHSVCSFQFVYKPLAKKQSGEKE